MSAPPRTAPSRGDLSDIRTQPAMMSDLTAVVERTQGRFFIKALRNRPNGRRDSIIRERVISPFVQSVSPALLWAAEDEQRPGLPSVAAPTGVCDDRRDARHYRPSRGDRAL